MQITHLKLLIWLGLPISACSPHTSLKTQPPMTAPSSPAPKRLTPPQLQGADLAQLCREAMKTWRCTDDEQLALDDAPDDEEDEQTPLGACTCKMTKTLHASTSKGPFKSAAILSIEGSDGFVGGSIDGAEHLAVETAAGGWQYVALLTNNYSPGAGGFSHSGTLESVNFQPLQAQEVLVVRYTNLGSERDPSTKTSDDSAAQRMLFCANTAQGAQCIELGTGGEQSKSALFDDEDSTTLPPSKQWTAHATITPEGKLKYILPGEQPNAPDYARALVGERALDEVAPVAHAHHLMVKSLR